MVLAKNFLKNLPVMETRYRTINERDFVKTSNEPNFRTEKFSAVSLKVTAKFH